jgi:hypothetical protein
MRSYSNWRESALLAHRQNGFSGYIEADIRPYSCNAYQL